MIGSKAQIGIISGVLIVCGLGLTLYKSLSLGLPLMPEQYQDVWTIESRIHFRPDEGPVEVELDLPRGYNGWYTLNENFSSSGFGFTVVENDDGSRKAQWTRSRLAEEATLYYKIEAYKAADNNLPKIPVPELDVDPVSPVLEKSAAGYITSLRERSNDDETFTRLLLQDFYADTVSQQAQFIMSETHESRLDTVLRVLRMAGIPAHRIRGIELEDGRRRQTLGAMLEVHIGKRWVVFNPVDGATGLPNDFYVWSRGDEAILSVVGGRNSTLQFALVENSIPLRTVVSMEQRSDQFALLDFSIYALPVEQQGIFKGLLLIPVAALVVVFMRVVVGVKTSGTFMPILIALALIQTTLLVGLAIFILLVSFGLWIRSYLSHMNLLLVARVAAVVIVVILMMAMFAIASYKLGVDEALTVTFFPTIILAWTIERMSILWEEEGVHEVMVQGGGSLLVAVLAYMVMSINVVEHLTFNFPELLFALLGVILLLGKYTGYRLSELYRFREMKTRS